MKSIILSLGLAFILCSAQDPYLKQLKSELQHNLIEISQKDTIPVYFGTYRVHDSAAWTLVADQGSLFSENISNSRTGEVELRLGGPWLDQTHPLADDNSLNSSGIVVVPLHLGDSVQKLNRRLWRMATEQAFRDAKERLFKVAQAAQTQRTSTTPLPDLAPTPILNTKTPVRVIKLDTARQHQLKNQLIALSQKFTSLKHLQLSQLIYKYSITQRILINTEGSEVVDLDTLSSLLLVLSSRHKDGSDISLVDTRSFKSMPTDREIQEISAEMGPELALLDSIYDAPLLDPYAGPVLLEGRAAAVFLHEILGHRVESDRFRLASDGQTFLSRLKQPILPNFISIYDNPLQKYMEDIPLNGHYHFDDEGVQAQGTTLVQDGILTNFLSNRSPALPNQFSTGNGRAVLGAKPMVRMSNLILSSQESSPDSLLRQKLIDLLQKENLPYGLIVKDLSGGFTNTARFMPQAFKLQPYYVLQVFADGRPDRLARGLDITGTPLVSLGRIHTTGQKPYVFNGFCGAESGWLPVSAVSPALLFDKLEFEKQQLQPALPPFLSVPRTQL